MTQAIDISGLTLKQVNENIADKTFTVAQVKAAITKKLSNPKMRKGAKARWTRALEQLSTKGAKGIDIGLAFTNGNKVAEDKPKGSKSKTKPEPKADTLSNDAMASFIAEQCDGDKDRMVAFLNAFAKHMS
ncbi:MAG: hypothetical protein VX902_07750 [Planctomycetota bacterium]|nr:hypothetical protein [Planctomycetota bacterium]